MLGLPWRLSVLVMWHQSVLLLRTVLPQTCHLMGRRRDDVERTGGGVFFVIQSLNMIGCKLSRCCYRCDNYFFLPNGFRIYLWLFVVLDVCCSPKIKGQSSHNNLILYLNIASIEYQLFTLYVLMYKGFGLVKFSFLWKLHSTLILQIKIILYFAIVLYFTTFIKKKKKISYPALPQTE